MQTLTFCYPRKTLPVSLTGSFCAFKCPWCEGQYLKNMTLLSGLKISALKRYFSVLISSGFDQKGRIPLKENFSLLKLLKEKGLRLNLHPGICEKEEIEILKVLSPLLSFDFTAAQKRLKSFELLLGENFNLIPHLLLGQNRGEIKAEYRSLKLLNRYSPEKLVFLVFTPKPGTAFAGFSPPKPAELEKFFAKAREELPAAAFYLGCLRPPGLLRDEIDFLALKYRFTKIVQPAKAVKDFAKSSEYLIKEEWECCAFD